MITFTSVQLLERARNFYELYYKENRLSGFEQRMEEIRSEIEHTGTYVQRTKELEYGARVAWRNSNRCIGRLFWKSLKIRDLRHLDTEQEIFDAVVGHLHLAGNGGKIKSLISIFRPFAPSDPNGIQIWNAKLIHYAGYPQADGSCIGDPSEIGFTKICQALGWRGKGTAFDVLPLVIQKVGKDPVFFELPESAVLEVKITHPGLPWLEGLGIKWYAVPAISDMVLEIGGVIYPCAPFNGWYMLSEIACRNLADEQRYHLLPVIAAHLGLDTGTKDQLWKDRCLLELNTAVQYSFSQQGITLVDHHTASGQFLQFCALESRAGREVQADWAWIVPPMSASTLGVFHREWTNEVKTPAFFYRDAPYHPAQGVRQKCPFHVHSLMPGTSA